MTDPLTVLSLVPIPTEVRERIATLAGDANIIDAVGWFDEEIRETWGDYLADLYLRQKPMDRPSRPERDETLADTDIVVGGFPLPIDLRARAPRLRWVHQTPAGASNLRRCDLWGSDVTVTTSRGLGDTLAIAEYVVASFLHFGRNFHRAYADKQAQQFNRFAYRPGLLANKTVCVVGAGGIGQEVGRLCSALGMRVVGTRRSTSGGPPAGFDVIAPADQLHDLLAEADFIAVCCQWTPETHNLLDRAAFAAMPDGAVVANVARGEIIDEEAMVDALDRLAGVALDVYVGEFEHAPPESLWGHENVLITPHVSFGSAQRSRRPLELFCRNFEAFTNGGELENVIDWERGY